MRFIAGEYDVAVIGAGHAGCEAALACAKLGVKTVIFAMNLDSVANMACNPSIGGSAKGQLVREIDALGGVMAKIVDKSAIQIRMLNKGKGPAVQSLRAQIDRRKYQQEMKHVLELQENLDLKQAEIVDMETVEEDGVRKVTHVVTHTGAVYKCKSAIVCTGTFLNGRIIIGDVSFQSGPDGLFPSIRLSDTLTNLGFKLIRLKTGTPARVNRRSIDFSNMVPQPGDEEAVPFSFETEELEIDQIPCWLTHTNIKTKEIILENIHRSPMYNGSIEGIGPRYCPSLEDKMVRFSDKDRHQVFVEPMGADTEEMYLQGMSSSLPEDVQIEFMRSVEGLENVSVMRPAYAIEYDAIDARVLKLTLESRFVDGLYFAGQINGSSGYEEAAAQGLVAGINCALKLQGKDPLFIDRSEAYIGVLIDDLVTRGTREPYRMMTSASEYRLLLRQDNADERLTEKGYKVGLISEERYANFKEKYRLVKVELDRLSKTHVSPTPSVIEYMEKIGSTPLKSGASLEDLLKRPEVDYEDVLAIEELNLKDKGLDYERKYLPKSVIEQVCINVKYSGYIKLQLQQVEQFKKLEKKLLPEDIDYDEISNLSMEAREKLSKVRPASIGQASRILGVSPADITALYIYLTRRKEK
ncbi:MAG TPA: tRNA uridine-5-carboxymethylaminomethyl(34) synthesis enzyme MnmG [Clostridiaceae bacterium]|nr:tRNA uridine-5-carboxymethylaminomethyl(34) synthesis enzyme MnmG [Clostridiaceae bacterium]HOA30505.1 tRNA uridine-5-carboxymethylaminomethyl(34) synthesis enzyme MnmG [Clostridia bacterium]